MSVTDVDRYVDANPFGDAAFPVTPAQAVFLDDIASPSGPDHADHVLHVELTRRIAPARVATAVRRTMLRHDGLRLRLAHDGSRWWQSCADPGDPPFESHDLSGVGDDEVEPAVAAVAAGARTSHTAPVRVEHLRLGGGRRDRMLVICNPLVVDELSLALVLDDLQGWLDGNGPAAPTAPYQIWAAALDRYASEAALAEQVPFWLAQRRRESVPVDRSEGAGSTGPRAVLTATLSRAAADAVARAAGAAGLDLADLLLAAVAATVARWQGGAHCTLAVASPGRRSPVPGIDVSRTIGRFEFCYPLRLHVDPGLTGLSAAAEVRRQVAAVPLDGLGYGLLLRTRGDERLADVAAPQVSFSYLAGSDATRPAGLLVPVAGSAGPEPAPAGARPHLLDVAAGFVDGAVRFAIHYDPAVHDASTVGRLLDEIGARLRGEAVEAG
ncbi:condensation domain-containing protein [Polymorphospora sp. NPDC050346]|uniref:condensation domain-containing protein n=1 Tax=Polymorphospora sp. NPDC050346 TaxID=3155780 RepID=UPI0033CE4F48